MKLWKLCAAAVAVTLAAGTAKAATLNITEILNYSGNGFGSSLIHDQTKGAMNGKKIARFDSDVSGTFDTDTGAISFSGSIFKGSDESVYTASGVLSASASRTDGLFGAIDFSFVGDLLDGLDLTFIFSDQTYTTGGEPNGFASNSTHDFVALWGDTGKHSTGTCQNGTCLGMDLRLAYEVAPVPLPASGLLLIAGLGGLGVARKLRKAT